MEPFELPQIPAWLMRSLVNHAQDDFVRFLLVVVRLSGLMILGPIFGQSTVPLQVRALLTLSLAFVVTPALPLQLERGFHELDRDGDGRIVAHELPGVLPARLADVQQAVFLERDTGLSLDGYLHWAGPRAPHTLLDLVTVAAGELLLGLLLGLGVTITLSGLQLAGQIIDQQAGFSLGEIINPDLDSTGSVSGQALAYLGMTLFIVLEPLNGHLVMLKTLVESFETIPLGSVTLRQPAVELVGGLVQQSLIVGVRVAAPLVVIMTLVDLTLGFLGHSVPQINIQAVGYAARASVCLLLLVFLLSDIPGVVLHTIPDVLEQLHAEILQT